MCVNEFFNFAFGAAHFGYVNSSRANENYLPNAQMSNKCDHRAHEPGHATPRYALVHGVLIFLVKCLLALKQSLKHANAINNTVVESRATLNGNRQR